ncbi:peptidase, partial [Streptococcus pyogenes]
MLTFGGASAVKADGQEEKAKARTELIGELAQGLEGIEKKTFPTPGGNVDNTYMLELLKHLQEREQDENNWRTRLLRGIQDHVLDGQDGQNGEQGPQGETGPTGPAGPQGPIGKQGDRGPAGPRGERGEAGPAGPAGKDGKAGAKGEV